MRSAKTRLRLHAPIGPTRPSCLSASSERPGPRGPSARTMAFPTVPSAALRSANRGSPPSTGSRHSSGSKCSTAASGPPGSGPPKSRQRRLDESHVYDPFAGPAEPDRDIDRQPGRSRWTGAPGERARLRRRHAAFGPEAGPNPIRIGPRRAGGVEVPCYIGGTDRLAKDRKAAALRPFAALCSIVTRETLADGAQRCRCHTLPGWSRFPSRWRFRDPMSG